MSIIELIREFKLKLPKGVRLNEISLKFSEEEFDKVHKWIRKHKDDSHEVSYYNSLEILHDPELDKQ